MQLEIFFRQRKVINIVLDRHPKNLPYLRPTNGRLDLVLWHIPIELRIDIIAKLGGGVLLQIIINSYFWEADKGLLSMLKLMVTACLFQPQEHALQVNLLVAMVIVCHVPGSAMAIMTVETAQMKHLKNAVRNKRELGDSRKYP